jgi:hypothetical protein
MIVKKTSDRQSEGSEMKKTEDKGKCRCSACRLEFRRLSGFDAHMVGPIGNRRHYSAPELKDRGWKQDSNGRWQMPPKNDRPNVFV